jgi:hypothetical protein
VLVAAVRWALVEGGEAVRWRKKIRRNEKKVNVGF